MSRADPPQSAAAIALNRFGLGARPDEDIPAAPEAWLGAQLERFEPNPPALSGLASGSRLLAEYREARRQQRVEERKIEAAGSPAPEVAALAAARVELDTRFRTALQDVARSAIVARVQCAVTSPTPFCERLVHFWANHFSVSSDNRDMTALVPDFEREAIRPHILGRFSDLLLAAEQHPAMLVYLNQAESVGPNSAFSQHPRRRDQPRKAGINENLGREIMELHTLGVGSGYGQADVAELSRALTGWTVEGIGAASVPGTPPTGRFEFRPSIHEPGPRTIRGRRYDQPDQGQARAALLDFATSEATATHIATKLARHFSQDAPAPALIRRLARSFMASGGDLPTVYRTLIAADEAWRPAAAKFKTPWEWTVSALRGFAVSDAAPLDPRRMLRDLGQPVWEPRSPAGYDDVAATWAAPSALLQRVQTAQWLANRIGEGFDARALAPRLLPASLSPATAAQLARAASGRIGLALLLVSPEFLRR